MQKYIERMITERKELRDRISKAKSAIANPPYGATKKSVILLGDQVKAMEDYEKCLSDRITYEQEK